MQSDEALIQYLEAVLRSLSGMAQVVSEPAYLMRQRPRDIARLYGRMSEAAFCLLRASLPLTRHDDPD